MPRLTRKEIQQQTRERLLTAAEEVIARRGVEAASLRDITEAAEYSLGAFYSNFESKEAMLGELLLRHMHKEIQAIREVIMDETCKPLTDTEARLGAVLKAMREDEVLTGLVIEFHIYARRNASFRRQFYESKTLRLAELAEGFKTLFERHGVQMSVDPMTLTQGFSALWVGFAIQGVEGGSQSADQVTNMFLTGLLNKPSKAQGRRRIFSPARGKS